MLDGPIIRDLCEQIAVSGMRSTSWVTDKVMLTAVKKGFDAETLQALWGLGNLSINYKSKRGWTWLHQAAVAGNLEAAKFFVALHVPLDARSFENSTAEAIANIAGFTEIAAYLNEQQGNAVEQ
jgi:ankyrin repeat protein